MLNRRTFLQSAVLGLFETKMQGHDQVQEKANIQGNQASRGQKVAKIAKSISIAQNIPFVKRPQRNLYLDVYHQREKRQDSVPAIIYFNLAAWISDTKKFWAYIEGLNHLDNSPLVYLYPPAMVPRGYVVVSAECRTAREAIFPAQIHDGKCAIKWVRAHAKDFNVDPRRIAVMGGSASGYLAAMLAVTRPEDGLEDRTCYRDFSSAVQASYCQSGMYDFPYYKQHPGDGSLSRQGVIKAFLGGSFAQIPKTWRRASPVNYVRPGDPPFLLMHGIQDTRVPYVQMGHFAKLLRKAGVFVEAISINHYKHGAIPGVMPQPSGQALDQVIYRFFDQHLKLIS